MQLEISLSAALRSKNIKTFGNIEVTVKDEDAGTYSIRWLNKMNLSSTTLHKVKHNFIIEIGGAQSADLARLTKDVREAFLGFFLSSDYERIDDDNITEARKYIASQLKYFEKTVDLRVPRSALRVLRRKSNKVLISDVPLNFDDDGNRLSEDAAKPNVPGRILFVYPAGTKADVRTPKGVETIPTDRIWYE